jgi:hypothetical protein
VRSKSMGGVRVSVQVDRFVQLMRHGMDPRVKPEDDEWDGSFR